MKIYPDVKSVIDPYEAILLDAFGVFWSGAGFYPGALDSIKSFVMAGKRVGVLSNSSQVSHKEMERYKKEGLIEGEHYHLFLTSGETVRHAAFQGLLPVKSLNKKYWVFGEQPANSPHRQVFEGTEYIECDAIDEADFIYLGIPLIQGQNQEDPELFRESVQKVAKKGLPVLCTNPDFYAHEGLPSRLVVRQGTIAAMFKEYGASVYYIGKPHPLVYQRVFEFWRDILPSKVLMVGDTPETDIKGANLSGMKSCLLLETGIMKERIEKQGLEEAISKLSIDETPTYFARRL